VYSCQHSPSFSVIHVHYQAIANMFEDVHDSATYAGACLPCFQSLSCWVSFASHTNIDFAPSSHVIKFELVQAVSQGQSMALVAPTTVAAAGPSVQVGSISAPSTAATSAVPTRVTSHVAVRETTLSPQVGSSLRDFVLWNSKHQFRTWPSSRCGRFL
jgi:hypothetical protein